LPYELVLTWRCWPDLRRGCVSQPRPMLRPSCGCGCGCGCGC